MPASPPTWSLDSGSEVNAEGNMITLNVRLSTPVANPWFTPTDTLFDIEATNASAAANKSKITGISAWQFQSDTGELFAPGALTVSQTVDTAGISDLAGPTTVGSNYELTFKYRVTLKNGARIAINNAASGPVTIAGLTMGWLIFSWTSGPGSTTAPAVTGGHPSLTIDADAVGMPPPGQDVSGSALKLFVDAHAEGVAQGASVSDLATWTDLSGFGNSLSGEPGNDTPALVAGSNTRPHVDFAIVSAGPQRFRTGASPPLITSPATIAAVIIPDTTSSSAHVVGRYANAGPAWRVYYDGSSPAMLGKAGYQATGPGGSVTETSDFNPSDTAVIYILRRKEDAGKTWEVWLNGRPTDDGTFSNGVNSGSSYLSVGARLTGLTTWGDGYTGEINQVALYGTDLTDLELSLLMHQMADRALVDLGTPIPSAWQNQPYIAQVNAKRLDRRPVANINLYGAQFNENMFGQSPLWRSPHGAAAIVANLKPSILKAMYACDQFEIAFNRPGGDYSQEPATTYVFGSKDGQDIITADQWAAMATLWDDLNLSDSNDDQNRDANHRPQRRGWFYTGSGLPLDDDGHLDTTGYMRNRQVAPAVPSVYYDNILIHWSNRDDRYRCFFIDAASLFFGKVVEMVHDSQINSNYILVGEAIPSDAEARAGAVWCSLVRFGRAPWWNNSTKDDGYNPSWSTDWETTPIYFGVQSGERPDFYNLLTNPQGGSNMKVGDIYKWVVKGATPMSWSRETDVKVGVAWNYGTARVMPSRLVRNPRCMRMARG